MTMQLFAYIGEEELLDAPPRVGLKQARVAAGMVPLVVMDFDRHKIERPDIVAQLQAQADMFGKTIRFARFEFVADVMVIKPRGRPAAGPVDCRQAGRGKGQCDMCAAGQYERCRYMVT